MRIVSSFSHRTRRTKNESPLQAYYDEMMVLSSRSIATFALIGEETTLVKSTKNFRFSRH